MKKMIQLILRVTYALSILLFLNSPIFAQCEDADFFANYSIDQDCGETVSFTVQTGGTYTPDLTSVFLYISFSPLQLYSYELEEFVYEYTGEFTLRYDPSEGGWYILNGSNPSLGITVSPDMSSISFTFDVDTYGEGFYTLIYDGAVSLLASPTTSGITGDFCISESTGDSQIDIFNYPFAADFYTYPILDLNDFYLEKDPNLYIAIPPIDCNSASSNAFLARLEDAAAIDYNDYNFTWSTGYQGVLHPCICTDQISLIAEHKESGCTYEATYEVDQLMEIIIFSTPCFAGPDYTHYVIGKIGNNYVFLNNVQYEIVWSDGFVGNYHPCVCGPLTVKVSDRYTKCSYHAAVTVSCTKDEQQINEGGIREEASSHHETSPIRELPFSGHLPRIDQQIKINIFPNPFSDFLLIQSEEEQLSYQIYNLEGKKIISSQMINPWEMISFPDLSPGSYWIQIQSPNGTFSQKIIKL